MSTTIIESGRPVAYKLGICWKGLLAGVITVLSLQLVLSVLGVAVGTSAVNPLTQQNPLQNLGWVAAWWWIVSGLISLAIGGYVSVAATAKQYNHADGELAGFLVWCVVNVAAAIAVAITAGKVVSGTAQIGASAISNGGAAVASQIDTTGIRTKIDNLIQQNAKQPGAGQGQPLTDLSSSVDAVFTLSGSDSDASKKDVLADVLVNRTNLTRDQAMAEINNYEASYNDAKAKFIADAKVKADAARKVARRTSVVIFLVLCLGAVAGMLGGRAAVTVEEKMVKIA